LINESIDKRIASVSGEDDILSDMEKELGSISSENLSLREENDRLRGLISANNIRLSESRESSRKQRQLIRDLRSRLAYHIKEEGSLKESIYQSSMENEGLSSKIAVIEKKLSSGSSEMSRLSESISSKDRTISRLKSSNDELRSEVSSLKASLSESEDRISKMNSDHKSKMKKVSESMSYLLYRYLISKCNQTGVDPEIAKIRLGTNYTYEDVDRVVNDLSDTKDRYSKLPFESASRVRAMVVESTARNREDEQTMEFIRSATNS
jgi:chromosome segregation ATPase